MKLLYSNENMLLIHSIKNVLEHNGISCIINNEHGFTMGAEFGIANTTMELWLPDASDFEKASTIVDTQILHPKIGEAWICDKCGEQLAGNFTQCWNCLALKPGLDESY